jgi:O-antigen/teichoic acid export membrane protein
VKTTKTIITNFSWIFGGSIFRSLSGLLVYILIARFLGPADYGLLQFYISIHFILLSLESIAHSNVVQNMYVNTPEQKNAISGSTFIILLASTVVITLGVFLDYFAIDRNRELLILVVLVSSLIFRSINPISYWYTAELRASRTIIAQSLGLLVSYILSIIFCILHKNIYYFAFAYSFQFFVTFLIHLIFYKNDGFTPRSWTFDKALAKNILKYSFPFLFSTTLFYVQSRLNMFFIKGLLTETDLGIYAAANQLSEPWKYVPSALVSSLLPKIIHHTKNYNKTFLERIFAFQFLTALIICLGTILCSDFFVTLLFSNKYAASIPILKILIWTNIFNFWFITQQTIDVETKTQKYMAYRLVIGLPLTSLAAYWFTKNYGISGAAYSAIISYFYYGFFSNILFKANHDILKIQLKSLLFWRYINKEILMGLYREFRSK